MKYFFFKIYCKSFVPTWAPQQVSVIGDSINYTNVSNSFFVSFLLFFYEAKSNSALRIIYGNFKKSLSCRCLNSFYARYSIVYCQTWIWKVFVEGIAESVSPVQNFLYGACMCQTKLSEKWPIAASSDLRRRMGLLWKRMQFQILPPRQWLMLFWTPTEFKQVLRK